MLPLGSQENQSPDMTESASGLLLKQVEGAIGCDSVA